MNEYKVVYRISTGSYERFQNIEMPDEFEIIEAEGAAMAIEEASRRCIQYNNAQPTSGDGICVAPLIKCVKDIWRL